MPGARRRKGETMGHSCLAFARAGLGYIYDESEITGDNVRYTIGERKDGRVPAESYRYGVCEKESGE